MDATGILDPALLALVGAVGATIWFVVAARRRGAARPLAAVASIAFFTGALIAALGAAHSLAVIGVALRRSPFEYNFRFYSLVLLGVLLVTGGLRCLASARKLTRGDRHAWRTALETTAALLAVNVPLVPIQGFAKGFSAFLIVNLIGLVLTRNRFAINSQGSRS